MISDLKRIMLAAVGTVATVYENIDKNINDMVKKGKITIEEGKELSEQLKKDVEVKTTQATNVMMERIEELKPLTKEDVRLMIAEYNIDIEEELKSLKNKLCEIEKLNVRLEKLEKNLTNRIDTIENK